MRSQLDTSADYEAGFYAGRDGEELSAAYSRHHGSARAHDPRGPATWSAFRDGYEAGLEESQAGHEAWLAEQAMHHRQDSLNNPCYGIHWHQGEPFEAPAGLFEAAHGHAAALSNPDQKLPRRGAVLRIAGPGGREALVKKAADGWSIRIALAGTAAIVRWGNAQETRADIQSFREFGFLTQAGPSLSNPALRRRLETRDKAGLIAYIRSQYPVGTHHWPPLEQDTNAQLLRMAKRLQAGKMPHQAGYVSPSASNPLDANEAALLRQWHRDASAMALDSRRAQPDRDYLQGRADGYAKAEDAFAPLSNPSGDGEYVVFLNRRPVGTIRHAREGSMGATPASLAQSVYGHLRKRARDKLTVADAWSVSSEVYDDAWEAGQENRRSNPTGYEPPWPLPIQPHPVTGEPWPVYWGHEAEPFTPQSINTYVKKLPDGTWHYMMAVGLDRPIGGVSGHRHPSPENRYARSEGVRATRKKAVQALRSELYSHFQEQIPPGTTLQIERGAKMEFPQPGRMFNPGLFSVREVKLAPYPGDPDTAWEVYSTASGKPGGFYYERGEAQAKAAGMNRSAAQGVRFPVLENPGGVSVKPIAGVMHKGYHLVNVDGTDAGVLRKFRDTRTDKHPWQAWLGIGHEQEFIGSFWPADGGKQAAVQAVVSGFRALPRFNPFEVGEEVGGGRWPMGGGNIPDRPWRGTVLAPDDPRAWAGSMAFPGGEPDPEAVREHVAKYPLGPGRYPVLWDFAGEQKVYYGTEGAGTHGLKPYAEDVAAWQVEHDRRKADHDARVAGRARSNPWFSPPAIQYVATFGNPPAQWSDGVDPVLAKAIRWAVSDYGVNGLGKVRDYIDPPELANEYSDQQIYDAVTAYRAGSRLPARHRRRRNPPRGRQGQDYRDPWQDLTPEMKAWLEENRGSLPVDSQWWDIVYKNRVAPGTLRVGKVGGRDYQVQRYDLGLNVNNEGWDTYPSWIGVGKTFWDQYDAERELLRLQGVEDWDNHYRNNPVCRAYPGGSPKAASRRNPAADKAAVKRYMRSIVHEQVDPYTGEVNYTRLAEEGARQFDHDDWLDDDTHWVWDASMEVGEAHEARNRQRPSPPPGSRYNPPSRLELDGGQQEILDGILMIVMNDAQLHAMPEAQAVARAWVIYKRAREETLHEDYQIARPAIVSDLKAIRRERKRDARRNPGFVVPAWAAPALANPLAARDLKQHLRPGDLVKVRGIRGGDSGNYGTWRWTGTGLVAEDTATIPRGTPWGSAHRGVKIDVVRLVGAPDSQILWDRGGAPAWSRTLENPYYYRQRGGRPHVVNVDPLWGEPLMKELWWPVVSRRGYGIVEEGDELLEGSGGGGRFLGGEGYGVELHIDPRSDAVHHAETPIQPPRTKLKTRWLQGRWEKLTKRGWTPA